MTTKRRLQASSQYSEKIKETLILLRGDFELSNREIALNLGVGENYLSNVFNGGKAGSEQLLKGLELLKEVIELRKQVASAKSPIAQEIAAIRQRLDEMERSVGPKYPEHPPQNWVMNEEKTASLNEEGKRALTEALQLVLKEAKKTAGSA